jgi:hypothetical protein
LPQSELLEEGRDLLHLLSRGRERVAVSARVDAEENGRQLDQLARRSEDDEDHERNSSTTPRHIPIACPSA